MWHLAHNWCTVLTEMNVFELNDHSYPSRPQVLKTCSAQRQASLLQEELLGTRWFWYPSTPTTCPSISVSPGPRTMPGTWFVLDKCLKEGGRERGRKERKEGRNPSCKEYLLLGRHGQSEQSSLCAAHPPPPLRLFSCTLDCRNSCFWYSSASSFSRSGSHSCTAGLWPLEEETHHTGYIQQAPARCPDVSAFLVTTPTWLPLVPQALFLHILFLLLGGPSLSSSFINCSPFKTQLKCSQHPMVQSGFPSRVFLDHNVVLSVHPQLDWALWGQQLCLLSLSMPSAQHWVGAQSHAE